MAEATDLAIAACWTVPFSYSVGRLQSLGHVDFDLFPLVGLHLVGSC